MARSNNPKTKGKGRSRNQSEAAKSSDSSGESGQDKNRQVDRIRKKIKELNPLRRARKNWIETDGSNNPNIQGADNGGNAWLDTKLNYDELDTEVKYQARYANKTLIMADVST